MNKRIVLFEIVFIVVAIFFYTYKVLVPEVRNSFGSSDKILNTSRYEGMYYFVIDDVRFSFLVDAKGEVYHMFFFEKNSVCLYNQDIENHDISFAFSRMIPILIENNLLRVDSSISVSYSSDTSILEVQNTFSQVLGEYQILTTVEYFKKSLEEIASLVSISGEDSYNLLENMDYFSKEVSRTYKGGNFHVERLDSNSVRSMANRVYRKLEEYVSKNSIKDLEKGTGEIDIHMIPADDGLKYYPSSKSWYYVVDGRVFAFIQLVDGSDVYSFCYSGSIDLRVEGECEK